MSTANKLTYLNTTKSKIKDSINLTGAGITNNDTFRSYSTKLKDGLINAINNGTDTIYNNFPKTTGTGTEITLNDTYNAPMEINLNGNSKQQILPNEYTQIDYIESSGTQYINTNYKPNANTNIITKCHVSDYTLSRNYICGVYNETNASPKNRYQICFGTISATANTMWCRGNEVHRFATNTTPTNPFIIETNGENITIDGTLYENIVTPTFDNTALSIYLFSCNSNGTVSSIATGVRIYTFKAYENSILKLDLIPCYRNSDNVIGMYDLVSKTFLTNAGTGTFIYGSVAPTPDSPVDIEVVTGNNNINICGKNLLPFTNQNFTISGINFYAQNGNLYLNGSTNGEIYSSNNSYKNKFSFILYPGTYTFSFNSTTAHSSAIRKKSDNTILGVSITGTGIVSTTFTLTETTECYLGIYIYKNSFNNRLMYYQLEKGDTATLYEPHQEQNYEINLGTLELCKIGNNKDVLFKNTTNSSLYNSSLTLNAWYKYKEIGKVVLDGSESYSINSSWNGANTNVYVYSLNNTNTNLLSNYFKYNSNAYANNISGSMCIVWSNGLLFRIDNTLASNVNDFKTWLSTHNTEVYYVLDTSIYEEITETTLINQLNNLKQNIKSYLNQTNITQTNAEQPFILDVSALLKEE